MNLFLRTLKLTDRHEDLLTEFLAVALHADRQLREKYARSFLGGYAERHGWKPPQIVDITTQASYPDQGRPDMLLTLNDGHVVACEHKIEAPETAMLVEGEESEPRKQLARYLGIPGVNALLYFRASFKSPTQDVLDHPGYIAPPDRAHYLWRDLYPLLQCS